MKKFLFLPALALFGLADTAQATRHQVPQQYPTVQAAINAAANSDTVLVAPGRYYENIIFRGKNITVASHFLTTGNRDFIRTTILDGSQPQYADSASVVRFINNEDSTTVLAGFTITGGKGTMWPDIHNPQPYPVFREGGGILCEGSSPVIRDNFIYNNEAVLVAGGAVSAGGGGIRADGGNPQILHNVIMRNRGRYGAGIVLNYCGGIVRNNIINLNTGGQDFGGAGIWLHRDGPAPKYIDNNTIVGNSSTLNGGGVFIWTTTATLRNNIIYGNTGGSNPQLFTQQGGLAVASYNLIQGGHPGPGSFSAYPMFSDSTGTLLPGSMAIDAGDPLAFFNDPASSADPSLALEPAMGMVRSDIGAYGGAGADWFTQFSQSSFLVVSTYNIAGATAGVAKTVKVPFINRGLANLVIDSMRVKSAGAEFQVLNSFPMTTRALMNDSLRLSWIPVNPGAFSDTLLVYHSDTSLVSPRKIKLTSAVINGLAEAQEQGFTLKQNHPNPFGSQTTVSYSLEKPAAVSLTVLDALGRQVLHQNLPGTAAGEYQLLLDGSQWPAGMYHLRLQLTPLSADQTPVLLSRKMVVAR